MTEYDAYPDHPLCGVPQEVLDVARKPVRDAAERHDVDSDVADPIADAVVAQLAEHGYLRFGRTSAVIARSTRRIQ